MNKKINEGYHMPDDEINSAVRDDDYNNDNYYSRFQRYGHRDYSTKHWADPDDPLAKDNLDDYRTNVRERDRDRLRAAPGGLDPKSSTTDLMSTIPKFMSLPIYGFKNPDYHAFVVTDHFQDLFKNISWDADTNLWAYGLKSTIKDVIGAINGEDVLANAALPSGIALLWKVYRSIEVATVTLKKLGYIRSIHFYGVQPEYGRFGFTEFRDNKINSFISSDFHTVLNPYEYIIFNHPVHAVEDGEVIEIVNDYPDKPRAFTELKFDTIDPTVKLHEYFGNKIVIKHNAVVRSVYANIKKNSAMVRIGEKVKKGQMICRVGCSGTFRSPFLLFLLRTGDLNVPLVTSPLQTTLNLINKKIPFVPNMWNTHFACNLMTIDEYHGKRTEEFYRRFDTTKIKYTANGTILRDCSLVKQFPRILVE